MRRFLLLLSFVLFVLFSYSQTVKRLVVDNSDQVPKYVEFDLNANAVPATKAVELLKQQLNAPAEMDFRLYRQESDPVFGQLLRFQQYYKGVKVEFGRYYVHVQNGKIKSINGDYEPVENLSIKPKITETQALEAAVKYINAKKYAWQTSGVPGYNGPNPQLVIVRDLNPAHRDTYRKFRLAYKLDIYSVEPVSRQYVYVDANTGQVLFKNQLIDFYKPGKQRIATLHKLFNISAKATVSKLMNSFKAKSTGTADTRYSGQRTITTDYVNGQYVLHDLTRGNGVFTYNMHQGTDYNSATDFYDNDNNWTSAEYHNSYKDDAALDAHWAGEMVYDYWKNVQGRNSFDNNNGAIKNYVHYSTNYDNAYWNGSVMTYGDGSGTYFDALTSLDVVAHEIGHAVCQYTADLTYQNESGALNEALSDIWGCTVEHYAAPEKETWVMGEDIDRRSDQSYPGLRDLSNPKAKGLPDTYGGEYWYTGTSDNGGVHTNMGPMSYAYYLMCEGGSGTNDLGNSYNVTGIGIDKAQKIIYRAEAYYLTNNTNYSDMRNYCIQAAKDLFGDGSQEVQTTTNAFYAIGVGPAYGQISYCESKGNSVQYEWIAKVQVGDFTNSSDGSGYQDFTSKTIDLSPGQTVNVALTPGFASSTYDEYFRIWIDYNHDGDFDDAGELVFDPGSTRSTITGSFTVPSNIGEVSTRMRVSMKWNATPSPCETFDYGEVEDYTVNISGSNTPVDNPPTAPTLSYSDVTSNSVTLSWSGATDDHQVAGYKIYENDSYLASTTATSYTVTGLTPSTTYSFYVKAYDDANQLSDPSNTVTITTEADNSNQPGPMPTGYCQSYGQNANYEWIDLVRLGNIDHSSGSDGGYADNTDLSTTLVPGQQYRIYVSAGFANYSYTEYWAIYFDFNRDGDFEDSGELVASGSSSSDAELYADFTVPSDASLGTTRLRVSMKYNSAQTPCEVFSYGEVEDYAVVISNQAFVPDNQGFAAANAKPLGNEKIDFLTLYPNPVRNVLYVSVPQNYRVDFAIYNMTGQSVKEGHLEAFSRSINVSDLAAGVYTIKFNDGQKEILRKFVKIQN